MRIEGLTLTTQSNSRNKNVRGDLNSRGKEPALSAEELMEAERLDVCHHDLRISQFTC